MIAHAHPTPPASAGQRQPVKMSVRQIAERLDTDVRTIQRWYRMGIMPKPIKWPGRKLFWHRQDAEQFIAEVLNGNLQ